MGLRVTRRSMTEADERFLEGLRDDYRDDVRGIRILLVLTLVAIALVILPNLLDFTIVSTIVMGVLASLVVIACVYETRNVFRRKRALARVRDTVVELECEASRVARIETTRSLFAFDVGEERFLLVDGEHLRVSKRWFPSSRFKVVVSPSFADPVFARVERCDDGAKMLAGRGRDEARREVEPPIVLVTGIAWEDVHRALEDGAATVLDLDAM